MARFAVRSANGGVFPNPRFPHRKQTTTEDYYCNVIESDVFPRIDGAVPGGDHFWRRHDLASSHAAQSSKEFLAINNLDTHHCPPSGASLPPHDVYVNPQLNQRPKENDLSKREKLKADVSRELVDMRGGLDLFI